MNSCYGKDVIDILLVGKTGQGKSATGNSILRQNTFGKNNAVMAKKFATKDGCSTFHKRDIHVVDTPGLRDIRLNNKGDIEQVINVMSEAMAINPQGYHAIVVVVRYGCRFTAEDVNTIQVLKKIFGSGFMKKHGILLFTCGDNFETDDEVLEENLTFEAWLSRQTEPNLQALIQECGSRAILFNNRCGDEVAKEKQLERLIEMVDGLTKDGKRYTNETFKLAEEERIRQWETVDKLHIKNEHLNRLSSIIQQLKTIKLTSKNLNHMLSNLQTLKSETETFISNLKNEGKISDAFTKAIQSMERLHSSIQDNLNRINLIANNIHNKSDSVEESGEANAKLEVVFKSNNVEGEDECWGDMQPVKILEDRAKETQTLNHNIDEGDSAEGRGFRQTDDTHHKLQSEMENLTQYVVAREPERMSISFYKIDSHVVQKQSLKEQHKEITNACHNVLDGEATVENLFAGKQEELNEQKEEVKRQIIHDNETFDRQLAQLPRLEEENTNIIQQAKEHKKLMIEAEKSVRIIQYADLEHGILENLTKIVKELVSNIVFKDGIV